MLNNSSNLYKVEWLNLVFKNRNQSYGAYALRSESANDTLRALFIGVSLFILLFASPKIYTLLNKSDEVVAVTPPTERIIDVVLPPKIEQPKPQEEIVLPKSEPINQKIKTVKVPSKPVVVADEKVVAVDPPTVKEMENAAVGPVTQDGLETDLASVPAFGEGNGTGAGAANGNGAATGNEIHDMVSVEAYPEFEGGMKAWYKFISKNLRYPSMALDQEKQGKVFISFVVERDGAISNVTVSRGAGFGMDEEAMRVIKKSPKWKAGRQNGEHVRVRFNMPISFTLGQ
ncbi:MAG: energy transducer TonB [Pedobacter sp.]|nr:MAG: energy transducer TonB [Pedobacter sp.]